MTFTSSQLRALKAQIRPKYIKSREAGGAILNYLEGWHAIAEANRIFGYDAWDRETISTQCVWTKQLTGRFAAAYLTRVRITVRAGETKIIREGFGAGEGSGNTPGEAHERAAKAAETDATKRALSTFGNPFGLSLYGGKSVARAAENAAPSSTGVRKIDKSQLTLPEPKRIRNEEHLKFVASQPCTICDRQPTQAHHLRFAQPNALGRKPSDEFTVPLCALHHRELHNCGNEREWWRKHRVDPLGVAEHLWTRGKNTDPVELTNGQIAGDDTAEGATLV
ncbi:MAG: Rad52/Rad22 family DNA repair protein [Hyphomicrobiales bacterium]